MDQYPQLLAYNDGANPPAVPDILVVGGVTVDGNRWDRSKVDVPGNPQVIKLYAPSFGINVPAPGGGWRNPNEVQGVSYGRHFYPALRLFAMRVWKNTDVCNDSCCNNFWTCDIFLRTF